LRFFLLRAGGQGDGGPRVYGLLHSGIASLMSELLLDDDFNAI
jgi:hypothetical protein